MLKTKMLMAAGLGALFGTMGAVAAPEKVTLKANALEPLPLGSVMPEGWLKRQLDLMTEGLVGRLYETSEFLTPENGWLKPDGTGWEEQPYWFRSFVKLAVLTRNERCLKVAADWVEKILATQDETGWFAGACVFLCSPAAAYIHGAIIPVDGGWLAR